MHATNVRNLKKNPSAALRHAEKEPVLVLKGDEPNALIVHLDASITEGEASVRPALAAALFREGVLSLGAARRLSRMELPDFIRYLTELGIDVVRPDETTDRERIAASLQSGWLRTRAPSAKSTSLSPSLGPGETEALLLAQEHPKSLLIVDDRLARRYALSRDIEIIGTVRLLWVAEREGMIEKAESVVAAMRAAGYRISIDLLEQVRQRHQP